jgi:ferrous iron transport protein B
MVLGIGCATMATLVTRTLTTKRERIISTLLLSLAIPCSAQLGVIISLLHKRILAFTIWGFVISLVFVLIGYLSKKFIPGEKSIFYMEIPPLRLPKISNILIKTYSRITWYFKEIIPIFIIASVLIYIGKITHVFDFLVYLMSFPVKMIGLPPEASNAFLLGFFRRDYGAAGLYDLNKAGLLSGIQLVVSSVVLTLFLPCVAQFLMNIRERGIKIGLSIAVFTLLFSFAVGLFLNYILTLTGVKL